MRRLPVILVLTLLAGTALADGERVRNPFGQIGKEGKREAITADYHIIRAKELAAAREAEARRKAEAEAEARRKADEARRKAAEAEAKRIASGKPPAGVGPKDDPKRVAGEAEWEAALRSIRVGGRLRVRHADGTERASIVLDGKPYAEGDLKTVTFGERRFTWRITGVGGGDDRLRLVRVNERVAPKEKGGGK